MTQHDSSLLPSDAEHDRHYCMFAVDDEQPDWLCKGCRETQDEAFPPDTAAHE